MLEAVQEANARAGRSVAPDRGSPGRTMHWNISKGLVRAAKIVSSGSGTVQRQLALRTLARSTSQALRSRDSAIRGTCRSRPHREKLRQTPLSRTAWAVFAQDNLASGWGPCRISKGRCISSRAFDKLSGKSGLRASTSRCCLETKDGRAAGALRPRHRYHLTVGNLNFVGGLWLDGRCLRTADTRRARRSIAAIDEGSFPVFHVFRTSYRGLVLVPGGLACHQRCRTHTFSIVFTKFHASTGTHAERMSRTNPGAKQESCSQR